ncbi:MAG TPA: hypothetical protein VM661_01050 [Candidatus Sulfotelmatobacter sp.]|jgi:hypothetical protein|nr:hypothetical protein [Candidatus Sulfotelmatobacter sp.]
MKTLKILVAMMAVLIVIGLGLLGWGLSRSANKMAAPVQSVSDLPTPSAAATPPVSAKSASGGYFSADISIPQGGKLEQMSTTADRVILRLSVPEGERLLVLDPTNGHVAGTVNLSSGR